MASLAKISEAVVRTKSPLSGNEASETAVAVGEHEPILFSTRRGSTDKAIGDDIGPMSASMRSSLMKSSTEERAVAELDPSSRMTSSISCPRTPPEALMMLMASVAT